MKRGKIPGCIQYMRFKQELLEEKKMRNEFFFCLMVGNCYFEYNGNKKTRKKGKNNTRRIYTIGLLDENEKKLCIYVRMK